VECPIEAVESDVGQKRGNDTPLRRAHIGWHEHVVLDHPGLEKSFDQIENVAVSDLSADAVHDDVVRDVVKEPFDVGVQHVVEALSLEFQHLSHGHVTAPERPEAVGVVMEDDLKERVQEVTNLLLSNAVGDCGNAQRACFPCVSFGDMDAAQGEGLIRSVLQATFERGQVL